MLLIKQYHSAIDAESDGSDLEAQGIPTHVSSKGSHSLSRSRTGAITVGLWVLLNHQYEDAVSYLKNRKYKVKTGITADEIKHLKEQAKVNTYNYMNKVLIYAGLLALLGIGFIACQVMTNGAASGV